MITYNILSERALNMQSNLYIPKKLVVGFKPRTDTFTNRLGFVTYKDEKGVLRQEKSWEGWRDKKIEPEYFDNIPQDHFLFNKDVRRYSHWGTTNKVRIYDPRDFEVEIDMSNVMFLLMHSDVSKRDITQECVYAWNGKNLVLLPTNSEEYLSSIEHTKKQETKFSLKELVLGHTYCTKNNVNYIYLGYYEWCDEDYNYTSGKTTLKNMGKKHIFAIETKRYKSENKFQVLNSNELCQCVVPQIHNDYSNLVEQLMSTKHMKKMGSFVTKKGFDTIGYKRSAYETLQLKIFDNDFKVLAVNLSCEDDKPKIVYEKVEKTSSSYYSYGYRNAVEKRHDIYVEKMKNLNLDPNKVQDIRDFFISQGFGTLYYTDTVGKKSVVDFN